MKRRRLLLGLMLAPVAVRAQPFNPTVRSRNSRRSGW